MERVLDWRPRHDVKSKLYPVRSLTGFNVTPRNRLWYESTVLDQGREGACVGYGWTGELITSPYRTKVDPEKGNQYARSLYNEAKVIDEWPGEDYEGTSVLAGAKILKARGLIDEYRWAFSIEDVRDAVIQTGPVVIGIPWYESMYDTRPDYLVEVSGEMVGGHCLILTGYLNRKTFDGKTTPVFRWRNSWGTDYGRNGSAYIRYEDLAVLLADNGEACVPIGSKKLVLT